MPVGCAWTTEYSNGNVWHETFVGMKDGTYRTEVRDGSAKGDLVSRKRFDATGRMVERVWANGKWERFRPYSCFDEVGTCTYTFTNADGVRTRIVNRTARNGEGYQVRAKPEGGPEYPPETFTLGPYGLMTSNRSTGYSARITAFAGCKADGA